MIWFCITLAISVTPIVCDHDIDTSNIKVFPAESQSVAGVFQVSVLDELQTLQYGFNASEAREICSTLGVTIASKTHLQEALSRGLETCRFGWIDEHFAVVPRIKALSNCGQNQTGLVTWRASVTKKFDAFCFNESDAVKQSEDVTSDSPKITSEQTHSPPETENSSSPSSSSSSSSSSVPPLSSWTPKNEDLEGEPARFVGTEQTSGGAKTIVITSTCALLLVAVIIVAYIRMRRRRSEVKKPESIEAEDWTKDEEKTESQEDERIQIDDNES